MDARLGFCRRREKSLPRRKTRGQRDQERNSKKKQSLNLTPTKSPSSAEVNFNNNFSMITQERQLGELPGKPVPAEDHHQQEEEEQETTLLLSSTKAVKEAVWQHERQRERQRMKQDF